jgi:membrane protease YdiL (CAAX protease family)
MYKPNARTQPSLATSKPALPGEIRPLGLWKSLILFGLPAALVWASMYVLRPFLERAGYAPLASFLAALTVPSALLFAVALVGYNKVEGRPLEWGAFRERMRFPSLTLRAVGQGLLVYLAAFVGYGLFSRLGLELVDAGVIPLPGNLPALIDPHVAFTPFTLDKLAGGSIHGQWSLVLLYLVAFFFNIAGEELCWRGFIFPRQEFSFGRWTWLVHGLLWTGFHAFKWWDMIGVLPVALALSYSAQRFRNNWPALIAHALINGLSLLLVAAGVAGLL